MLVSSVQFSSVTQLCLTLCGPVNCSTPGLLIHHQLLESTQTHVRQVGDAIQPSHLCHSLLLLPPFLPSIRVFSNESTLCMRWPKFWSFSFNISPSNEHPGLISFQCISKWFNYTYVYYFLYYFPLLVFIGYCRENAMATHSSTLAWKIPWTEGPGRLQSMGSLGVGHDQATSLSLFTLMLGEGNGNPLQCSCLENPRDREPCGLPSMGLHRVGYDWSDLAAAAAAVLIYLITGSLYLSTTFIQSSPFLTPLVATNLISFSVCVVGLLVGFF